jgi:hypothetical protein
MIDWNAPLMLAGARKSEAYRTPGADKDGNYAVTFRRPNNTDFRFEFFYPDGKSTSSAATLENRTPQLAEYDLVVVVAMASGVTISEVFENPIDAANWVKNKTLIARKTVKLIEGDGV